MFAMAGIVQRAGSLAGAPAEGIETGRERGFCGGADTIAPWIHYPTRARRRRRRGRDGPAHRRVEGRAVGRRGRHAARPGRVHRPRRPDQQHDAAPRRDPRAVLADAGLAAARRGRSRACTANGRLAALDAGAVAGARDAPAARRDDGLRHAAGAALQRPSLRRGQHLHHRPAVHAAAARGRVWALAAGSRRGHRANAVAWCSARLLRLERRGTAARGPRRARSLHAGHRRRAPARHADGLQHRALALWRSTPRTSTRASTRCWTRSRTSLRPLRARRDAPRAHGTTACSTSPPSARASTS